MKLEKTLIKTALTAVIALGAVVESTNATQIHTDYAAMSQQEAKRAASRLRHQVENPDTVVPQFAKTDFVEMYKAAKVGNLAKFAEDYGRAITAAIKRYVTWNLIHPGHNKDADVLLTATAANRDNAATNADVYALVTNAGGAAAPRAVYNAGGGWGQTPGGVGGAVVAGAGMVENDMPADLTIGAFFTAMEHRLTHVALAELHNLSTTALRNPITGPHAIPAHLPSGMVTAVKDNLRDAIKDDLERWLAAIETGGAEIFIPQVANNAGHALYQANITDAGHNAPGMFSTGAPIASPAVPVDLTAARLTARFNGVIDLVDAF